MSRIFTTTLTAFLIVICTTAAFSQAYQRPSTEPPKEEFRSAWVATVTGAMDWPKGDTVEQHKASLKQVIQRTVEMRMNAIVFQVVGRGDALFESERLPWSMNLTGTLGQHPGWDPLQYLIDEARKYGLEVHAWYNVFNVGDAARINDYAAADNPKHVYYIFQEHIHEVENRLWINPGVPEVRQWAVDNVVEIVSNYDVDAIHFDFIRYPNSGFPGNIDFNTRQAYDPDFQGSLADWRRNNVNQFNRDVYAAIQEIKPWVKVGSTPVGHYRSAPWLAFLGYSAAFQDGPRWLEEGVNDYLAPQIYWSLDGPPNAPTPRFEYLTKDWKQNSHGRHIYVGIGAYQTGSHNVAAEIGKQIDTVRTDGNHGHMFFRFDSIYKGFPPAFNPQQPIVDYIHRAMVPSMDWKDMDVPPAPVIAGGIDDPSASIASNDFYLQWETPDFVTASGDTKVSYAIYRVRADDQPDPIAAMQDPANLLALTGENMYYDRITEEGTYYYFVTAYSRNWVESVPSNVVEHYTPTSIETGSPIAERFTLDQNYPNPFNPSTQIRFTLGESAHATLTVYDMMGRVVATLVDGALPSGSHSARFDAQHLSSGVYIYTLRAGDFISTKKMMLIK